MTPRRRSHTAAPEPLGPRRLQQVGRLVIALVLIGCETMDDYVGAVVQANGAAVDTGDAGTPDADSEMVNSAGTASAQPEGPPAAAAPVTDENDPVDSGPDNGSEIAIEPDGGGDGTDVDNMSGAEEQLPCDPTEVLYKYDFRRSWLRVSEGCTVRVDNALSIWFTGTPTTEQRFFVESVIRLRRGLSAPPEGGECSAEQAEDWWMEYQLLLGTQYAHFCPAICERAAALIEEVVAYGCGDLDKVSPEIRALLDNAPTVSATVAGTP